MTATEFEFRHRLWFFWGIYLAAFLCYGFEQASAGEAVARLLVECARWFERGHGNSARDDRRCWPQLRFAGQRTESDFAGNERLRSEEQKKAFHEYIA